MNKANSSLDVISKILNMSDFKSDDVYCFAVQLVCNYFQELKNKSCGIFFIENTDSKLKFALNNKKNVLKYIINKKFFEALFLSDSNYILLETTKDSLLYNNTLLVKLSIKNSVFGFLVFSSESQLLNENIDTICAFASAISYKIKDYELNEVFKMQLKALQAAIIEKEEANLIIEKQNKKLQKADKTKSLFLANISHELRTPLNAIIGFSQALESKIFGDLNEKQLEYINDIQISGLHLLGMINEILDLSKLEANALKFSPSKINANQIIQEVINVLGPLYRVKNIVVNFISSYDGNINADYQKFQQILYNLLSNAIKFTPKNGNIVIKSYVFEKKYMLEISDSGIGIDKKYHNKIFKKFVHLNNIYSVNQSSTGLGLTITKELVKLHNGKIMLESELNKGTTFKMEFKNILL